MPRLILLIFITELISTALTASQFDNSVLEQPTVYCERDQIRVEVETERPFNGRIYVKGEFRNKNCVRSFTDGRVTSEEDSSSEETSTSYIQSRRENDGSQTNHGESNPSGKDHVIGDQVTERSRTSDALGSGKSNEGDGSNSGSNTKAGEKSDRIRIENGKITRPTFDHQKGPSSDDSDNDLISTSKYSAVGSTTRVTPAPWIFGSHSTASTVGQAKTTGNFPFKSNGNTLTTQFGGSFAPRNGENGEPTPLLKLYPQKGRPTAKTFPSALGTLNPGKGMNSQNQNCPLVCVPCECGREERHRRDNRYRVEFVVPLGSCNAKRDRTITPPSLVTSFIVHVSFHESFVTKYDRAYNVKCKYVESTIPLTTQINVTMSDSLNISGEVPSPKCSYLVTTLNGNSVTNVRVGDLVKHTWKCETNTKDIYSMLVHSCFIEDGGGERFQIIDEYGCSVDEGILGTPQYSSDGLTATREAFTFKYPDKSSLDFQCSFRTCTKDDKHCGAPPDCSTSRHRVRRSSDFFDLSQTIHSNSLNVLDVDNDALTRVPPSSSLSTKELCLSVFGFGVLVSVLTFLFTTSMASAVALYFYRKFKSQY